MEETAAAATDRRPRLHFTPRQGWINDPYGVVWRGDRYHYFFQRVPDSTEWQLGQHWGHATSPDLVHWTELPTVLAPDEDDDGIWSGSVVIGEDGDAVAFYTSVTTSDPGLARVRIARPTDESWETWQKGTVVAAPPEGMDLVEVRDPFVFRHGDRWQMIVGGGTTTGTALALSWTSPDLTAWSFDGILAARPATEDDPVWTGTAWECPQLLRVGDRWVLVVSVWADGLTRYVAGVVGDLTDGRFESTGPWQRFTYGPSHYAASAFVDADGRPCLLHWLRDVADVPAGWAGAHSVPHVVALDGERLVLEPHPAVAAAVRTLDLPADGAVVTTEAGDATLEVGGGVLTVSRGGAAFSMPCDGGPVHILLDGPTLEIFGPDGVAGLAIEP
ncbi:MAG: glycoside hydrolase family 32 protein [Nocardioides sp.]|uniref:glycoside hydrolase family 32 protein n=1 Tax=Nocardioides sp. TaxID=35761 RepID=UPI0039E5B6DB